MINNLQTIELEEDIEYVKNKKKTYQIHIQISKELKEELINLAEREHLSITDLLIFRAFDYDKMRDLIKYSKDLKDSTEIIDEVATKLSKLIKPKA